MKSNPVSLTAGTPVVAYLRDSGGNEQDLSVDQQRRVLTDWCTEHNLLLTTVFADMATPGSTVVGREQFQAMIRHFHDPAHSERAVILWKYSRFSRDLDDAQFYKADLRRRGVAIYSINDNIPDTIDGRAYETLIDWMNARFLEDLSTDVKRGLHHLLQTYGALPGTPPRGFRREPVAIGTHRDGSQHTACRWVPDEASWELCRQAWHMRAAGMPIKTIHEQTHLFRNRTSYNDFFRNRLYLGELHYGGIAIERYAPAMIEPAIWEAVQRLNRSHSDKNDPRRHPRRVSSAYLLSGMLYCLKCGSLMVGKTVSFRDKKRMAYYQCSGAQARMACDARRVPAPAIEALVERYLHEYILDPAVILERDRELRLASEGSQQVYARERRRLNDQLNDTRKRLKNLVDRMSEEEDPPRSILTTIRELELREADLSARLDRLRALENREQVFLSGREEAEQLAAQFRQRWEGASLVYRRTILRGLVRKITVERDGNLLRGMIHFYSPGKTDLNEKLPPDDGGSSSDDNDFCLHDGASTEYRPIGKIYTLTYEILLKNRKIS